MTADEKDRLLLQNEHIYLRVLQKSDITEEYIYGLNDPEVNQYLVDVRRTVQTHGTVSQFIKFNLETESCILFGIFIKNDAESFVGTVRILEINLFHYSASIGICLFAKRAWGKGYALQALEMVKDYLFNTLKLHYLEAGVYAENLKSISCFLHAGFVEQYRVIKKYRYVGSFEDVIIFAAVNPRFDPSILK